MGSDVNRRGETKRRRGKETRDATKTYFGTWKIAQRRDVVGIDEQKIKQSGKTHDGESNAAIDS